MSIPFDINKFEKEKNYVIKASAGTGKTHSIIEIVGKLLEDVDINDILLLTYTNKAAEELRNRVRSKVNEMGKEVDVDNASICTFHAFCKKTIEEFFISTGKLLELDIVEDKEFKDFAKQYVKTGDIKKEIEAYLCEHLAPNVKNSKKFEDTKDIEDSVIGYMSALIKKYYLNASWKADDSIVSLDPIYKELIINLKHPKDVMPEIDNALNVFRRSGESRLNELYDVLVENIDLKFDGRRFKVDEKYTAEENEAIELVYNTRESIKKLKGFDFKKIVAINHIDDVYHKWDEYKLRNKKQTYDDMIRTVREEVVNNGPLVDVLRKRYKYVIIDEFQDTNQLQWDIFKTVFLCEDHHIIVVGDEKQSIYSFQKSDIHVFNKATSEIIAAGGLDTCLDKNYRSSKKMIECTDYVFEDVLPGFTGSKQASEKKLLNAFYNGTETEAYWISDRDEDEKTYAATVTQTIVDCCTYDKNGNTKLQLVDEDGNYRNVSFKDFTVLCRKKDEFNEITYAFRKSGIPFAKYKDDSLFKEKVSSDLLILLDAVNTPDFTGNKRLKFKKAMSTAFFGYSLAEIKSDEFDSDNIPEIMMFDRWRQVVAERKWEALIDGIYSDTCIREKLGSIDSVKKLGILKQLSDYCVDYLFATNSLDMLITDLANNINNSDSDKGTEVVAKSTDFDSVQLITTHSAKGLQFPVVISVFGVESGEKSESFYTYHNLDGKRIIGFDSKLYDIEASEERRRLMYVAYTRAEYLLILPGMETEGRYDFVGKCTSAFIENHSGKKRDISNNGKSFEDLKKEVAEILKHNTKRVADSVTESDQRDVAKKIKNGIYWHDSFKHAYSSLSHSKAAENIISNTAISVNNGEDEIDMGLAEFDEKGIQVPCDYDANQDPIKLCDNYPAGAGLGNAVHDVLELTDYAKTCELDLIETCFKGQGLKRNPDWFGSTKAMIDELVEAKLPVIHGREATREHFTLSSIDFDHRRNEVEFNFNKENELLKRFFNGFVDLIIRRGDYFSILDWKSDKLKDDFTAYNDGKILKDHVDKKYAIQRVLYSYTLIKWLKNFYRDLSEEEIFEKHFGGVYYLFIRGCNKGSGNGIYAQTWENYGDLKAAYDKIVKAKIGGVKEEKATEAENENAEDENAGGENI